jgi:hypothetical protein
MQPQLLLIARSEPSRRYWVVLACRNPRIRHRTVLGERWTGQSKEFVEVNRELAVKGPQNMDETHDSQRYTRHG